jgi:ssDNA-binding Zn-finger/Zn-ribbon topoisomerase 1
MDHDCPIDISDGPCGDCENEKEVGERRMKLKSIGEKCPDCDGYLVERVNSITKNTFIGCSEWPDCNYTKRGGENPAPVTSSYYEGADLYDDFDDDYLYGGDGFWD